MPPTPQLKQQDLQTFQRARTAALLGLAVQFVLGLVVALLSLYTQSNAVVAATWHLFAGLPVWIITWFWYNQHYLERLEALEHERLAADDAEAAAIFEEAGDQLALARKRLSWIQRIGVNIFSVFVALWLLIAGGLLFWGHYGLFNQEGNALAAAAFPTDGSLNLPILLFMFIATSLAAFFVARYVAGMTAVKDWQALRGGASFMMGSAIVLTALLVAATMAYFNDQRGFTVLALAIPAFMILLGAEILLAFIAGIYRPRKPGQFVRPAFDSRFLGWTSRPEALGKIIRDTINYQFGFEISSSWFFQLLNKAALPLAIVCFLAIVAMTSIVIVQPQEQGIVTKFGKYTHTAEPGLSLKWPWPAGGVTKYDVGKVHQIHIGSRSGKDIDPTVPLLWTNQHLSGDDQEDYLLTAPTRSTAEGLDTDAQNRIGELVGADVYVKYRINDLAKYVGADMATAGSAAIDPHAYLTAIAEQEVNRYFGRHDIDYLLTEGRREAGEQLLNDLQQRINDENLGVRVTFVSVSGIRPPQLQDVALTFQAKINAEQERITALQQAEREAIETLATVAGTRDRAMEIAEAIVQLEATREAADTGEIDQDQLAERIVSIESMLDEAGGEAAQKLLEARAYRWNYAITQRARAERFNSELRAYRQAPEYYRMRMYLDVLSETLADRRKIIVDTRDGADPEIVIDITEQSLGGDLFGSE